MPIPTYKHAETGVIIEHLRRMTALKDRKPAFIITIGASAGGLNAIGEVVAQLPEELDAAVFIVLHLSKVGLGQFLVSRLQKYTAFTCMIPKDGDKIEKGHVYIAPPDTHLLMDQEQIILGQGPAENRWRPSIDVLFRSAAASFGNRVIGIILTGYLNDGTAGMSAIKRSNGYCIVQDPTEAQYPDMPLSVLDTIDTDFCIPLNKMGETIVSIIKDAGPEQTAAHGDVLKEAEVAGKAVISIDAVSALGQRVPFACPDCGGGLWNIDEHNINRYRCHIGHSYTEKDLLIKQGQSLEATLWVALRMMEERRMLLLKISDEESSQGFLKLASSHVERAGDLKVHIEKLRQLLFATKKE